MQYLAQSSRLIPLVDKANPNYKAQVGEVIYEFVEKISDENLAPKITGMLIDLPIEDIKSYLANFNILEEKVKQAESLLREQWDPVNSATNWLTWLIGLKHLTNIYSYLYIIYLSSFFSQQLYS